jgi:hypothetical protein
MPTKIFATILSTSLLFAAASASALTVSTGVTGNVQTNTGVTSAVGVQASVGASSSAGTNLSVPLVVTRTDLNDNTVQATNVSVGNVTTKSDLSGYIAAKLQSDINLYAIDTASDHVAVTYPERAEFLGFIPVIVETTATTDAGGNVSITQPWWSFIAAGDNTTLQSSVQSNVTAVLGANASANTELSAAQQAQLIATIESAMSSAYTASGSASVSSQ